MTPELRKRLERKLAEKQKAEGKRAVTDADRRRWLLPETEWREWEVPFDTDSDWPAQLTDALVAYRTAWRAKMDEVNATIAASAEQEKLVDQPEVERGVVRVAGPFTMEAVMPAEQSDGEPGFGGHRRLSARQVRPQLPAPGRHVQWTAAAHAFQLPVSPGCEDHHLVRAGSEAMGSRLSKAKEVR